MGIIDTQQLGSIHHSSKKHDPVEDARGSQQLAVGFSWNQKFEISIQEQNGLI